MSQFATKLCEDFSQEGRHIIRGSLLALITASLLVTTPAFATTHDRAYVSSEGTSLGAFASADRSATASAQDGSFSLSTKVSTNALTGVSFGSVGIGEAYSIARAHFVDRNNEQLPAQYTATSTLSFSKLTALATGPAVRSSSTVTLELYLLGEYVDYHYGNRSTRYVSNQPTKLTIHCSDSSRTQCAPNIAPEISSTIYCPMGCRWVEARLAIVSHSTGWGEQTTSAGATGTYDSLEWYVQGASQ